MASTPEGRRLTEAHRQAQQQVRDDFLAEFIALWVLLDSARLDETGPGWIRAVLRLVATYRLLSAQASTAYYYDFAAVEAPRPELIVPESSRPNTPPPPSGPNTGRPPRQAGQQPLPRDRRPRGENVIPEPRRSPGVRFEIDESAFERGAQRRTRIEIPDIDWSERDRAVEVSLIVTGPIGQKSKRSRGKTEQVARDESFVESSGAASRHVLTGGRRSLLRLAEDDMQLKGWIRVTDGDPCYFCAMLASRGPVFYDEESSGRRANESEGQHRKRDRRQFVGEGAFKVHDHCACTAEAVYVTDTGWPGRASEFQQLWNDNIRGKYSGDEARRAWRRLYEGLQREARREQIA